VYVENPVVVRVSVVFKQSLLVKDYTAKLVKTLLIAGNPRLEDVFSRTTSPLPKPLHVTPLYTYRRGEEGAKKLEAVYTKHISKGSTARPPSIDKLKPVELEAGREYFFYISTTLALLGDVLQGLSSADRFVFGYGEVVVEKLSYELEYVDVEREAEGIRKLLESTDNKRVKVVFESPTLLKDPLVPAALRWKKKKVFTALPEAVFATPFYMVLYDIGKLRDSIFEDCMLYLRSVLNTPYTERKTANLVWYVYNGKPLPALIGYVKYYLDAEALHRAQKVMELEHSLDFIDAFAKSIVLAKVYGIGDGRATGFGHTTIAIYGPGNNLQLSSLFRFPS